MLPLGRGPRDRQGNLQRPRGGAPHRRAAPRPEARERDGRRGRQAAPHGLRHRRRERRLRSAERDRSRARRSSSRRSSCRARRRACGPTSTRWASSSTRCSRDACRSTTTTRRGSCAASSGRRRPRSRACGRTCRPSSRAILDRAIAKDPQARFADATALADAIAAFEGQVLDRVLAEVSVTRAKMVKLMVILEANKSLAATFDPTETLRIILRTATSETDAERGTIFLRDPGRDELVSQILEGGSVAPIRLPSGRGIAGTVAETGEIVNVGDAYNDRRFDSRTDAGSGFHTVSILAAPLRTPAGEIVGVVEILNKRRGQLHEGGRGVPRGGRHARRARRRGRPAARGGGRAGPPRRRGAGAARRLGAPRAARLAGDAGLRVGAAALELGRAEPARRSRSRRAGPRRLPPRRAAPASPRTRSRSLLRALEAGRRLLPEATPAEIVAAIGRSRRRLRGRPRRAGTGDARLGRRGRTAPRLPALLRDGGAPLAGNGRSNDAAAGDGRDLLERLASPAAARRGCVRPPAAPARAVRAARRGAAAVRGIRAARRRLEAGGRLDRRPRRPPARRAAGVTLRSCVTSSWTSSRTGRSRATRSPSSPTPRGLDDATLQLVAREMDHAATAFLLPGGDAGADVPAADLLARARDPVRGPSGSRRPLRPRDESGGRVRRAGRRASRTRAADGVVEVELVVEDGRIVQLRLDAAPAGDGPEARDRRGRRAWPKRSASPRKRSRRRTSRCASSSTGLPVADRPGRDARRRSSRRGPGTACCGDLLEGQRRDARLRVHEGDAGGALGRPRPRVRHGRLGRGARRRSRGGRARGVPRLAQRGDGPAGDRRSRSSRVTP